MTFGVGEVGAVISIADVAARVGIRLARFLAESKDAGETRNSLHTTATDLREILTAIETATRKRSGQVQTKPISEDEDRILVILKAAVGRCESTVEKFEKKLGGLGRGGTELRWRERFALQLRLDVHQSGIARVERDIRADIASLQLLFTCFSP